ALDDFGSGLSSFNYLKNFVVDVIKIDGSFVRNLDKSPVDQAIVDSINQIAHRLGAVTVAEFVESREILDHLARLGVDFAQGYAVGR
ncbi:EAL domain-containing protein, partial [Pseudomonas aeruginosa]